MARLGRAGVALVLGFIAAASLSAGQAAITKYVQYSVAGATSYGIPKGDAIRELKGDLFASPIIPHGERDWQKQDLQWFRAKANKAILGGS